MVGAGSARKLDPTIYVEWVGGHGGVLHSASEVLTYNRLRVFKIANTARLGRGEGQERWLRMGPSEKYVAR